MSAPLTTRQMSFNVNILRAKLDVTQIDTLWVRSFSVFRRPARMCSVACLVVYRRMACTVIKTFRM